MQPSIIKRRRLWSFVGFFNRVRSLTKGKRHGLSAAAWNLRVLHILLSMPECKDYVAGVTAQAEEVIDLT